MGDDHLRPDHFSRAEIGKDAVQSTVEAAADTAGEVAKIVTRAVQDVASAIGGFATELYEIRDAAQKARHEHSDPAEPELPAADPAATEPPDADLSES